MNNYQWTFRHGRVSVHSGSARTGWRSALPIAAFVLAQVSVFGQTTVDLSRQARNVDFSHAGTTTPFASGAVLPQTCNPGQAFFKIDAAPGQNLYFCTAVNAWTLHSILAGPGIVTAGQVVGIDDAVVPQYYTGSGQPALACVAGRDYYVDTVGRALYYCHSANTWAPAGALSSSYLVQTPDPALPNAQALSALGTGLLKVLPNGVLGVAGVADLPAAAARTDRDNAYTSGVQDFGGAAATIPARLGVALPASCRPGELLFRTDVTAGQNLFFCTATNSWSQMSGTGGGGGSGVKPFYLYFPAAKCNRGVPGPAFSLPAGNAPAVNCGGVNFTGGTNRADGVLTFTASGQSVEDHFQLPPDQAGAVDLQLAFNSTTTAGNVVWNIATACIANGALSDPGLGAADTFSTAAQGTTLWLNSASKTAITLNNCAPGSELFWRIGLDASTTAAVDASHYVNLLGVRFLVRRNF